MKETRPLLTASGKDYQEKDGFCTKRNIIIIVVIFLILLTVGLLIGFLVDWTDDEESIETGNNQYWQEEFTSLPSADSCKEISVALGSKPHVAGTPEQIETGTYVKEFFEDLEGFEVEIQEWDDTVLDHFVSSSLKWSLNASAGFDELDIAEEILEEDPDTNTEYASYIWNAYSASDTVQGNIVYINYGRRSDYVDIIADEGYPQISGAEYFQGKIGLVRYGNGGRSTKVKVGQDYGMIGLLMFSDPNQYAPDQDEVYPNGPWLPPTGVQRGSIKYSSCPGNPTLERLERLCGINDTDDALPTIPVMPLSYSNAEIIFGVMREDGGDIPPVSWTQEAYQTLENLTLIDIGYTLDSDNFVVELEVTTDLRENDTTQNVYGIIYGDEYPDEVVMIGAHRDSWVCGAQDDVSGTTTIMEVAKGFGNLYGRGWRPKRTIVFASWDSEESGLIGSSNFGEDVVDGNGAVGDLNLDGIIAYVNLDMTTGDDVFGASGNPLLGGVSFEAMRQTPLLNERGEFEEYETFWDAWSAQGREWGILGAGSDHTVFAFYMGVAAMDTGFGGPKAWGAYHSMYDTIGWQEVVDPNWMKAEDIARYTGVLTMKLIDERVIPFDLGIFASVVQGWFTNTESNGLMGAMDTYNCYPNDVIPGVNITDDTLMIIDEFVDVAGQLNTAINALRNRTADDDSSDSVDSNENDSDEDGFDDDDMISIVNEFLGGLSKAFSSDDGLPERIWYKNMLWDPAPEDGPTNVFPYIWYALESGCNVDRLQTAFDLTQGLFNDAIASMQEVLGNVTQSN